jgi:hypothetical protein
MERTGAFLFISRVVFSLAVETFVSVVRIFVPLAMQRRCMQSESSRVT